jgi:hypothetical protein
MPPEMTDQRWLFAGLPPEFDPLMQTVFDWDDGIAASIGPTIELDEIDDLVTMRATGVDARIDAAITDARSRLTGRVERDQTLHDIARWARWVLLGLALAMIPAVWMLGTATSERVARDRFRWAIERKRPTERNAPEPEPASST